jgi:hypothetical protein
MKRLQRFNEIDALKALRDGAKKGYWTVEQLDSPPPGTKLTLDEYKRHPMNQNLKTDPPSYRNLLRDAEDNQEPDFVL